MIILFDGVCNLCNAWVNFVLDRDPSGTFSFAAQQSAAGQAMIGARGLGGAPLTAIVLVADERVYVGSSAILEICARLGNPWRALAVLRVIPRPFRDFLYGFVARRRYRWFGKSDTCRVPAPDIKRRFIE
ncbi:MAG TPA: DCC1-like thiol-disulfide oxidoreductase family protein [bacterium]|nr:DCC1-like thiol-disulfide oxidoreductase family protein [bacterium]